MFVSQDRRLAINFIMKTSVWEKIQNPCKKFVKHYEWRRTSIWMQATSSHRKSKLDSTKEIHDYKCGESQLGRIESITKYMELHLVNIEISIHDGISWNNVKIFSVPVKAKTKLKDKIFDLRRDYNLFCRIYVAAQHGEIGVDKMFCSWKPGFS